MLYFSPGQFGRRKTYLVQKKESSLKNKLLILLSLFPLASSCTIMNSLLLYFESQDQDPGQVPMDSSLPQPTKTQQYWLWRCTSKHVPCLPSFLTTPAGKSCMGPSPQLQLLKGRGESIVLSHSAALGKPSRDAVTPRFSWLDEPSTSSALTRQERQGSTSPCITQLGSEHPSI